MWTVIWMTICRELGLSARRRAWSAKHPRTNHSRPKNKNFYPVMKWGNKLWASCRGRAATINSTTWVGRRQPHNNSKKRIRSPDKHYSTWSRLGRSTWLPARNSARWRLHLNLLGQRSTQHRTTGNKSLRRINATRSATVSRVQA